MSGAGRWQSSPMWVTSSFVYQARKQQAHLLPRSTSESSHTLNAHVHRGTSHSHAQVWNSLSSCRPSQWMTMKSLMPGAVTILNYRTLQCFRLTSNDYSFKRFPHGHKSTISACTVRQDASVCLTNGSVIQPMCPEHFQGSAPLPLRCPLFCSCMMQKCLCACFPLATAQLLLSAMASD